MGAPTGPDGHGAAALARLLGELGQAPPTAHHRFTAARLSYLDEAAHGFVSLHRDDAELAAAHRRFAAARSALRRAPAHPAEEPWREMVAAAHLAGLLAGLGDERVVRCARPTVEGSTCSSPLDPVTGRCTRPRTTYGFWFTVTSDPGRFNGEDTIAATVARRAHDAEPVCRWIADDPGALARVADSYAAAIRAALPVEVEMHPARSDLDPPSGEEFDGPAHLDDCSWPAAYPRTPAGGLDLPTLLGRIDLGPLLVRIPRPSDPGA